MEGARESAGEEVKGLAEEGDGVGSGIEFELEGAGGGRGQ